jgi:hypothetical protein
MHAFLRAEESYNMVETWATLERMVDCGKITEAIGAIFWTIGMTFLTAGTNFFLIQLFESAESEEKDNWESIVVLFELSFQFV